MLRVTKTMTTEFFYSCPNEWLDQKEIQKRMAKLYPEPLDVSKLGTHLNIFVNQLFLESKVVENKSNKVIKKYRYLEE